MRTVRGVLHVAGGPQLSDVACAGACADVEANAETHVQSHSSEKHFRIRGKRAESQRGAVASATVDTPKADAARPAEGAAASAESFPSHSHLLLLSWNVAGIGKAEFSEFLDSVCAEFDWSVAALQELGTWAAGQHFYFREAVLIAGAKRAGSKPGGMLIKRDWYQSYLRRWMLIGC